MKKAALPGNCMLTDFFEPKTAQTTTEPPAKRPRIEDASKPLSPSPSPSTATVTASSAEQKDVAPPASNNANASFTSMRSNSSKRVVTSSGQQAVMGSDSDTDELEELEELLKLNKPKAKPVPVLRPFSSTPANVVSQKPKQKSYRFNLARLVEEKQQQTAMEARIAAAQADIYEASKEPGERSPNKDSIKAVLSENANTDDAGKARRVMEALERTDAFERHDVWHFFEEEIVKAPKNPFPRITHSNPMLKTTLNDPQRRRQAFRSGFIQRIAETMPLPEELLSWIMLEVCRERNEYLLSAYLATMAQAVKPESSCLAPESLRRCFRALGAKSEALAEDAPIVHSRMGTNERALSTNPSLLPFVRMLSSVCHKLPIDTMDTVAHFLVRACFDHGVRSDRSAHAAVEDCLTGLFNSYKPGDELDEAFARIAKALFQSVKSASLRQQLVSSLPATSTRAHHFRQSLALAFVLDKERHLDADLTNPALTGRLLLLFDQGSALRIKKDTDYVELRARLSTLDIALDAGFSDFAFLDNEDKKAEKKFNESIDALTDSVRELSARIIDAGAAHMTRTEAKVVAERVVQRLEYAVRTKEKPQKDWFGEQKKKEAQQFMKGWIASKDEDEGTKQEPDTEIKSKPKVKFSEPSNRKEEKIETIAAPAWNTQDIKSPNATQSPIRKIVIRGGSASPMAQKNKKSLMERFSEV